MLTTVSLPNSKALTSRFGVGLATLMREPSPSRQQELLHAAYDAGFRHFDVAPSYGMGAAERVLGRFLRTRPDGVTIATKVGIVVRSSMSGLRLIQRPARALLKVLPSLRGRVTSAAGSVIHTRSNFSTTACTQSLENSLRALGTDYLDLLLLHDPEPADLADGSVFSWLARQKERGVVRNIGIASSASEAGQLITSSHPYDVIQVPSNVLSPAGSSLDLTASRPLCVTHSAIAEPLRHILRRIAEERWALAFSDVAGVDVRRPGVIPRLLLSWALHENQKGIVLVGASKPQHFQEAGRVSDGARGDHLEEVADFLRSSFSSESRS